MNDWLLVLCVVLFVIIIILAVRLYLVEKAADEILSAFHERLITDTNTLIDISSNNRHIKRLAFGINQELKLLKKERHRFLQGNTELKEAVMNVSHDLRTPLTAIFGYLDLLESEQKSESVTRFLSMISNRAYALKQLVEELFQYSILASQEEETKELVNINSALEESIAAFYGVMKQKHIEPQIVITEKRVVRLLNRRSLLRIFENIIHNAIKYTDGDLSISLNEEGNIFFANQAKGLSTILVGRLFDRFYTVQSGQNSTGLGLSIAKLLTEQEGGTIAADYKEDRLQIMLSFPNNEVNEIKTL